MPVYMVMSWMSVWPPVIDHLPPSTQLSRYTSYRRRQQTTTTMTPPRPRRRNAAAGSSSSSSNPSSDDTVPHPLGGLAVR